MLSLVCSILTAATTTAWQSLGSNTVALTKDPYFQFSGSARQTCCTKRLIQHMRDLWNWINKPIVHLKKPKTSKDCTCFIGLLIFPEKLQVFTIWLNWRYQLPVKRVQKHTSWMAVIGLLCMHAGYNNL